MAVSVGNNRAFMAISCPASNLRLKNDCMARLDLRHNTKSVGMTSPP